MERNRNPLPLRILILLDRLSNVQFSSLTRKQLKDQVEELKLALIEEFTKLAPASERPHQASNVSDRTQNYERPSPKSSHAEPRKDERKVQPRSEKVQLVKETSAKLVKETASKSVKNVCNAKPSYSDLLKMAESVRKESSPNNVKNRDIAANFPEEFKRNGSHGYPKNINSSNQSTSRSRNNEVPRRDAKQDLYHSDVRKRNSVEVNTRKNFAHSRSNQEKDPGIKSTPSEVRRSTANRADEKSIDTMNGNKDQSKKGREPRKSKKDEEEEIIARKRLNIREENERVRIRNEVLAGKRSASELKNVVKQVSHGNTVLSCRPASTSDHSSRRNDSSFGRPVVGRRDQPNSVSGREFLDEYDEEEDDDSFIDDDEGRQDDDDNPDVSKAIRDIFGYDKRKYIGMDEDIEEASYSQILKEEARSQRIGRQEDLADMREEMRQKKLKKERLKQLNSRR